MKVPLNLFAGCVSGCHNGVCDVDTGVCTCHSGFFTEDCSRGKIIHVIKHIKIFGPFDFNTVKVEIFNGIKFHYSTKIVHFTGIKIHLWKVFVGKLNFH